MLNVIDFHLNLNLEILTVSCLHNPTITSITLYIYERLSTENAWQPPAPLKLITVLPATNGVSENVVHLP